MEIRIGTVYLGDNFLIHNKQNLFCISESYKINTCRKETEEEEKAKIKTKIKFVSFEIIFLKNANL